MTAIAALATTSPVRAWSRGRRQRSTPKHAILPGRVRVDALLDAAGRSRIRPPRRVRLIDLVPGWAVSLLGSLTTFVLAADVMIGVRG